MSDSAPAPGALPTTPRNKPYQPQNQRYAGGRNRDYEDQARTRKALAIANHLQQRGVTADHVENMHPNLRAHHAASAGVPSPSDETWTMVGRLMQNHEASRAKTTQPGYDPFAGL